jgi:hypothetical protein
MGYMVYVDEKPTSSVVNSLKEAKEFAAPYIVNGPSIRIESFVAPAPSQIWIYDYQIKDWVEQV